MEKMGLLKTEKMGDYEKKQGYASYRTIIDYYVGDIVLCNNIINVDDSVYDNLMLEEETKYYNENDEEITEDEYYEDDNAYCETNTPEIFQWYLCNVSEYKKEQLQKAGIIMSYSDKLDCDVLCVNHWGTSWDYVLTSVKLFDTYEELKAYEEGESNNGE